MVSLSAAVVALALTAAGPNTNQTVLLDFYSDSCGPCRAMDPVVKQLAAQGYPVRQVNVERERQLAMRFGITRIPCFVMLVDGREVDRVEGLVGGSRLVQMLAKGKPAGATPAAALADGGAAPANVPGPGYCPVPADRPAAIPPAAGPVAGNGPPKSDAELIAFTARLRIEDRDGWSCGSGTLVDCREGWALILTCGHLFRDSKGQGRIQVDLFGGNAAEGIPGELVSYDDRRDVGLVRIRVPRSVVFARVAPAGTVARPGDPIVTVGCDHGAPPTARHAQVTSVNKYLGEANVEVSDVPVVGRSGGGLFTPDGQVIGVCNAAEPAGKEGLYAALPTVHKEFDQANLAHIYRAPLTSPPAAVAAAATAPAAVPAPAMQPIHRSPTVAVADAAALKPEESALLDEVRRRTAEGAEVIVVVRPRNKPNAPSEVMMLEQASAALLQKLAAETGVPSGPQLTSLEVPRPSAPTPPRLVVLPQP